MANITGNKSGNIITLGGLDYGKKYSVVMTPTTANLDGLGLNEGVSSDFSFYSGMEDKIITGSLDKKNNNIAFTRFDSIKGAEQYQIEFLEVIDDLAYVREIKRFDSDFFSEKHELEKLGTYYSARVFPIFRDDLGNQCWGNGVSPGSTIEIKPQDIDITALNTLEDNRTLSVAWSYYDELYNNFKSITLELLSDTGTQITDKYVLSNLRGLYQDLTLSNPYDNFDNYPYMTLKVTIECKSGITLETSYKVTDGIEDVWITNITSTSMRVNWNPVHGAHYYSVKIDKGGSVIETRTTADSSVFYDAQNLESGIEYGFQILALDKYKRPLNNNNNYSPREWAYTNLKNVSNYSYKVNESLSSIEVYNITPEGEPDPGITYEIQLRSIGSKGDNGYTFDGVLFRKEEVAKPNESVANNGGVLFTGLPRGLHYEIGVRTKKNELIGDIKSNYVSIGILDIKSAFVGNGSNSMRYGYEITEGSNADNYTHMPVSFDSSKILFNNFGDLKTGNLLNIPNNIKILSANSRVYYKVLLQSAYNDNPNDESKVYPSYVYTKRVYGDIERFYTTLDTSVATDVNSDKIYTMFGCNYYLRIYLVVETPGMPDIISKEYIKGTIVFPMYNSSLLNSLKSKSYISYRKTDSHKNHGAYHIFGTLSWSGDEVHFIKSMSMKFEMRSGARYTTSYYSYNKYTNSYSKTSDKWNSVSDGSGSGGFDSRYYRNATWQAGSYVYYSVGSQKFGMGTCTLGSGHHDSYWGRGRTGRIYFHGKNGSWSAIHNSNVTGGSYSVVRNPYKQS